MFKRASRGEVFQDGEEFQEIIPACEASHSRQSVDPGAARAVDHVRTHDAEGRVKLQLAAQTRHLNFGPTVNLATTIFKLNLPEATCAAASPTRPDPLPRQFAGPAAGRRCTREADRHVSARCKNGNYELAARGL